MQRNLEIRGEKGMTLMSKLGRWKGRGGRGGDALARDQLAHWMSIAMPVQIIINNT